MADPEIIIIVEPPSPDVNVVVEPAVSAPEVVVSQVALPGRNGVDGQDATDAGGAVYEHIHSPLPHPVYDDGPSLSSFYQNQKV